MKFVLVFIATLLGASESAFPVMQESVDGSVFGTYLTAAISGGWMCRPKVAIAFSVSKSVGEKVIQQRIKPIVSELEKHLAQLPFHGNDTEAHQGPEVLLVPYHNTASVIDLETPMKSYDENLAAIEGVFDKLYESNNGACIACALQAAGKATYHLAKTWIPSFIILITDGHMNFSKGQFQVSYAEAVEQNIQWKIEHLIIGIKGKRGVPNNKLHKLGRTGGFWQLNDKDFGLAAVALEIADHIAGAGCTPAM